MISFRKIGKDLVQIDLVDHELKLDHNVILDREELAKEIDNLKQVVNEIEEFLNKE